MSNSRRARPRRRVGTKQAKRSFLLFVEGGTEEIYLTNWGRALREHAVIQFSPVKGVPLTLVNAAVEAKHRGQQEARRGRGPTWNEVWCMFDCDEHPNVPEAMRLAADHEIQIAYSNPCIELWFLLHARSQTAEIDRHQAQSQCRSELGMDKSPPTSILDQLRVGCDEAIHRAKTLDRKHEGDGNPPGSNPSSSVWRLIEALRTSADQANRG